MRSPGPIVAPVPLRGGSDSTVTTATPISKPPQPTRPTTDRANPRKIFEAIEATNVPINFWGKVVDQDSQALSGVRVEYDYSIEHGNLLGVAWSDQERRTGEALTNGDGLFSIQGLRGHALSLLAFKHPEYQFRSKGAVSFDFYGSTASGKFAPNQSKPVAFTMVRKDRLEPLVHSKGGLRVRADGTPERWNLWEGEADPNGELMVILRREPGVLQRPGQPAKWSADLQIVSGGIIEASWDEDVRRAPEAGYVDSIPYPEREQKPGVPYRAFYIKTVDGKFGRLQIELDPPRGEGTAAACYIACDMNPRPGSRNLEPSDED